MSNHVCTYNCIFENRRCYKGELRLNYSEKLLIRQALQLIPGHPLTTAEQSALADKLGQLIKDAAAVVLQVSDET